MYRVGEYLTPSERMDAMRVGGLKKLASYGMSPSDLGPVMEKTGQATQSLQLLGTALRTAVMIGAPLGAVLYALHGALRNDNLKTKKLKATLDHYNDVSFDTRMRMGDQEDEENA